LQPGSQRDDKQKALKNKKIGSIIVYYEKLQENQNRIEPIRIFIWIQPGLSLFLQIFIHNNGKLRVM